MEKEDSLQFVEERLRHHQLAPPGEFRPYAMPRIVRRFAIALEQDESHIFDHVEAGFTIRCMRGGVWITQEEDPSNAILVTGESYRAEREDALYLYALTSVELEIEFEDEVTLH